MSEQKKEIETIKERTLKLKLSDADCDRVSKLCGEHNITVGELIENFIGDLVCGTYSNGSDERMYADQWFDRCWFGMFPEETLLKHLLDWGYEPADYLDTLDNLETAKEEKKYLEQHPEEADEMSYLDEELVGYQKALKEYTEDWKPEKEPNMSEEIEALKKWVQEVKELKGE